MACGVARVVRVVVAAAVLCVDFPGRNLPARDLMPLAPQAYGHDANFDLTPGFVRLRIGLGPVKE